MTEASQCGLYADLPPIFALSTGQSNGTENRVKPGTDLGDDLVVVGDQHGVTSENLRRLSFDLWGRACIAAHFSLTDRDTFFFPLCWWA
jgi:hypothetical protein